MVSRTIADGIAAGDFVDLPPDIAARGVLAMANWGYTWFQPDGRLHGRGRGRDVRGHRVAPGLGGR